MDIKELALILLIGRIISDLFIFAVLRRQWQLITARYKDRLDKMRWVLFSVSVVIFLGNMIPIGIDIATLLADVGRAQPTSVGIMYAFSSNIPMLMLSVLMWFVYHLADPKRDHYN